MMESDKDVFNDGDDSKKGNRFQVNRVRYASLPGEENSADVFLNSRQSENVELEGALEQSGLGSPAESSHDHAADCRSCDSARTSVSDTLRKFETHNLNTFGKNTHEALPHLNFYRNAESVDASQYKRPTLDELREEKEEEEILVKETPSEPVGTPKKAAKFGWIRGVLVRCLLSIWGVLLFLRLSWMVGQAGIGLATVIVLLSTVVTVITALSMSAICTNGEIKAGGIYFMISRSLGPEFGGAIGIIFSLANAVAISMHVVGFAEVVVAILQEHGITIYDVTNDVRIIGVITCLMLVAIAIAGLAWEAYAQLSLLLILVVSLLNFSIGAFLPPSEQKRQQGFVGLHNGSSPFFDNLGPSWREGHDFFSVFAIFFPSATGIAAGASISGDLKDPSNAIPKGTFLAIMTTSLSYIICIWLLGATVLRDASGSVEECSDNCLYGLMNDYRVMELVSGWGPLIIAGLFAAALSSALGNIVGSPKIFQAVCKDEIFPYIKIFAKGYGPTDEPRLAYLLSCFIGVCFILIGDLNAIAPLISNFYLMAYALVNYSCFDASLSNSPGWRPAFKYYSMYTSLFGAVLCVAAMFLIKWWASLITFVFVAGLGAYVHYKKPDVNWGSSTQAHVYRVTLASALKLVSTKEHVKNFRPQILCLSGAPHSRPALVDFANNITKGISLLVCGHIISTKDGQPRKIAVHPNKLQRVYDLMSKRHVKAFYNYIVSQSLRDGAASLMQSVGIGKLRPNMLLLGFKRDWLQCPPQDVHDYVNIIQDGFDARFGVGILRVERGFDISHYITEEDLVHASHTKPLEHMPLGPNAIQDLSQMMEEDEEFDTDEVVLTTLMNNRKIQRHKLPEVNRFHHKQSRGTIDVWWLFDDGGLTLLIPHILSTKPYWQSCKLRVFLAGTKKEELNKEQKNMATLLSKFRIDYQDMEVIPTFGKPPSTESKQVFDKILSQWQGCAAAAESSSGTKSVPLIVTQQDLDTHKERTNRHLRVRDLVYERSRNAALVVLTLPIPRKGMPVPLYMTWIDCLSRNLPAPVLLLRGNQEPVLTFYS